MRRLSFLASSLALAAAVLPLQACSPETSPPPDIVIVCIDALRADHLGTYGHKRQTSPHIDALAAQALVYEQAWSASSWTKPSIPSLFTGLPPSEHGVFEGSHTESADRITSDVLAADHVTLAEALRQRGYRTAAFVKNAQLRAFLGFDQGFDRYVEEAGEAEEIVGHFLAWYNQQAGSPRFAYLHILDVHWPYRPREPYDRLFGETPGTIDFSTDRWRALRDDINDGRLVPSAADLARMVELYDGLIAQVDAALQRLFDALARDARSPVVVITADHGEEFYEHGKIGHGHSLSENLLHVPLILSIPGQAPGRITQPCSHLDLFPTLAHLAGAEVPSYLPGRDLLAAATSSSLQVAEVRHRSRHEIAWREGALKLVRTYRPEEVSPEPEDEIILRDDLRIEASFEREAERAPGEALRASKVEIKTHQEEDGVEVQGWLSRLDPAAREVQVFALNGKLSENTRIDDGQGNPITLDAFAVGDPVEMDGELRDDGTLEVDTLRRVEAQDAKLQLEGRASHVTKDGKQTLVELAGHKVMVDADTRLKDKRKPTEAPAPAAAAETASPFLPARLLAEEGLKVREKLHDLAADPEEHVDLAGEKHDDARTLAAHLERWLERAAKLWGNRVAARTGLDTSTVDELREIGYVR
ncbi:MAG: sulfatase-like hydrolase/transferase [Planctomycetota bacterium]